MTEEDMRRPRYSTSERFSCISIASKSQIDSKETKVIHALSDIIVVSYPLGGLSSRLCDWSRYSEWLHTGASAWRLLVDTVLMLQWSKLAKYWRVKELYWIRDGVLMWGASCQAVSFWRSEILAGALEVASCGQSTSQFEAVRFEDAAPSWSDAWATLTATSE